jgi:HD-GYP domain-containing protein (c-di-GMP phosphodiesterase class II)
MVFHYDFEVLKAFAFWFESQLGIEVDSQCDFEKAVAKINSSEPPELIIAGECVPTSTLFEYLIRTKNKTAVIYIGKNEDVVSLISQGLNLIGTMKITDEPGKILPIFQKHFKNEDTHKNSKSGYCRIHISLLLRTIPLGGDIYVKLNESKYVKLFKKGALFTQEDLSKIWHVKKLDYLYIHRFDADSFIERLQEDLERIIQSASEDKREIQNEIIAAQDAIQSLASLLGFSPKVVEVTKASVRATLKLIGKNPKLKDLVFEDLLKQQESISTHSIMIAQVACCIASKMNWPSETVFQKLVLAAFLHDIALPKPEYSKIRNKKQLMMYKDHIDPFEFDRLKNHPYAGGEMIMSIPDIPQDVFNILIQHHEDPEGKGFPRGLNAASISPLAAIFIIAEEAVHLYSESRGNIEIEKYLSTEVPDYTSGAFRKISQSLKAA